MRVKTGTVRHRRHKKVKKQTKGMIKARQASFKLGKQAVIRSLQNSYRDRRARKRQFRKLWIMRINAGARQNNSSYRELIKLLKDANININRKCCQSLPASTRILSNGWLRFVRSPRPID